MKNSGKSQLWNVLLVAIGIWGMALLIHAYRLPAAGCLLLSTVAIVLGSRSPENFRRITGMESFAPRAGWYVLLGVVTGILLGLVYGLTYEAPLFPTRLAFGALAAPLVGMIEELLFRGYIQGQLARLSVWGAIVLASLGHSIYKVLVIYSYPVDLQIHLFDLFLFTFLAGIFFGWLRLKAGNLLPALLAHGIFDIMVYGALANLPGWVWW